METPKFFSKGKGMMNTLKTRAAGIAYCIGLLLVGSFGACAQTAVIVGYSANLDAYNNTGGAVYGFEIEADGIQPSDVTRVFPSNSPVPPGSACVIRYCAGTVIPFARGAYIR